MRRHRHHIGPDIGFKVEIGMVREQHLDDIGMLLRHRPHERRLAARAMHIRIPALSEQQFDHFRVPRARGHHDGSFPARRAAFGFAPASRSFLTIAVLPF